MLDVRVHFGKVLFEEPDEDFSISTAQTDYVEAAGGHQQLLHA